LCWAHTSVAHSPLTPHAAYPASVLSACVSRRALQKSLTVESREVMNVFGDAGVTATLRVGGKEVSFLGDAESSLGDAKSFLGDAESSLGDAKSFLGDAVSSQGDAESSLGDAKSSLGDAESSLGDAKSSLGDAKSSLGDAKSSLGDAGGGRRWRRDVRACGALASARGLGGAGGQVCRHSARCVRSRETRARERERERVDLVGAHTGGGNALAFKPPRMRPGWCRNSFEHHTVQR
jgi:hypothetical protein